MRKINEGDGTLFSPELREVVKRMKQAPPELAEVIGQGELHADRDDAEHPGTPYMGVQTGYEGGCEGGN